jgi:hypothetical protein
MNLLRYEFIEAPDDSINGMLRTLVTALRYNRSYVPIEDFKRSLPELYQIELKLQQLDARIGKVKRNYIQEIMDALQQEQENEANIAEDLRHAATATIRAFFGRSLNLDELSYSMGRADHYHWLQLSGYSNGKESDGVLVLVKEVFRSVCNTYNYIFIDLT